MTRVVTWLDDALVKAAVPLAPETVLRTLADAAGDTPPLVTLHLSGGQVLDGSLVSIGTDRDRGVVVLADLDMGRLGYVLLSSVVAVELGDAGPFRDLLTGGRVPVVQAGQPITRLALRREFAPTTEFPVDVDWAALDESGHVLGNLASLLGGLRDAVAEVRDDDLGQRAWAQVRLLQVEHRAGSDLTVLPIPGGLAVQADLTAALPRALRGELVRMISALL